MSVGVDSSFEIIPWEARTVSEQIKEQEEELNGLFALVKTRLQQDLSLAEELLPLDRLIHTFKDRLPVGASLEAFNVVAEAARATFQHLIIQPPETSLLCKPSNQQEREKRVDALFIEWVSAAAFFSYSPCLVGGFQVSLALFKPQIRARLRIDPPILPYEYALLKVGDLDLDLNFMTLLESLLERGYQQVDAPIEGDLVLYLADGVPAHMGVYRDDGLVESKWGGQPLVFVHAAQNVPATYGNQIGYFRPPSPEDLEVQGITAFIPFINQVATPDASPDEI